MTDDQQFRAQMERLDEAGRDRLRANALRLAGSENPKEATKAGSLLKAIDMFEEEKHAEDRATAEGPLRQRVLRCFNRKPPTEKERKLLQAILDAPGSTSAALSRRVGYDGQAWHLHFGKMCSERQAVLGSAPDVRRDGAPFWSGVLCDYDDRTATWTLKPDVETALSELGFRAAP